MQADGEVVDDPQRIAFLQQAPCQVPADEAAAEETGEIIVTAQKRAENVQSVPVSIAAFNGETLEKSNVLTVMDLPRIASNFQSVRSSNTGQS